METQDWISIFILFWQENTVSRDTETDLKTSAGEKMVTGLHTRKCNSVTPPSHLQTRNQIQNVSSEPRDVWGKMHYRELSTAFTPLLSLLEPLRLWGTQRVEDIGWSHPFDIPVLSVLSSSQKEVPFFFLKLYILHAN